MNPITSGTLAHEALFEDECRIGVFFAAFGIQYSISGKASKKRISVAFAKRFKGEALQSSQRAFVRRFMSEKGMHDVVRGMWDFFDEQDSPLPHEKFLAGINKAFLIRQIFGRTDQVLSKYEFIGKISGTKEGSDLKLIEGFLSNMPFEQKVLALSKLFSDLRDESSGKEKELTASFRENMMKMVADLKFKKDMSDAYENVERMFSEIEA